MTRSNWPPAIIAGLALAAVIGAVATVGGPAQGRIEKRDHARYDAIRTIAKIAKCRALENDKSLPETLEPGSKCNNVKYPTANDLGFDASFKYTKLNEQTFEICSDFEDLDTLRTWSYGADSFNRKTGCLSQKYNPS